MASEPEQAEAPPSERSPSDAPSTRRRGEVLATLAIVGALVAAVVARPLLHRMAAHPSREQCVKMLDRYAEEQDRAVDPARGEGERSLDDAPTRTLAASTIDRCARDLTKDDVDCALRSNGADELERCISP